MQKMFRESGHFAARHELDRLSPTSAITVSLATRRQLVDLVAIARREIPGVNASEAGLAQFLRDDPESIFAFERAGKLLGGIAFLYLNCRGHDQSGCRPAAASARFRTSTRFTRLTLGIAVPAHSRHGILCWYRHRRSA